jgi:toxin-antitoxin system PIN domain toxin
VLLVDANVLLHAVNRRAREHEVARRWMVEALAGSEAVGFAWMVALAFMRLTTQPAIFARPLDIDQAGTVLERWLGAPQAVVVEPTRRHLGLLRGLLASAGTAGNLVSDPISGRSRSSTTP